MEKSEYFQVVTPQKAREILSRFSYREEEKIQTQTAFHRFLAEDIVSPENIPPFSRSTMDGYAVASKDTIGASSSQPLFLRLTGSIEVGHPAKTPLGPGEAFRIPTGGMIPPGGDAVVMVEHARLIEEDGRSVIELTRPMSPWENVMRAGEDFKEGDIIVHKGQRLRPQDIGAIAGVGIRTISVLKRPVVGLIATGDELVPLGQNPQEGQVRSINPYALGAAITDSGAIVNDLGLIPDALDILKEKIEFALHHCDFILISGGSSLGERDLTLEALGSFEGSQILFHGMAVAPGKPTIAASLGPKLAIGLPGHPASAFVVFTVFVRPLLQGQDQWEWKPCVRAILSKNVPSASGREEYARVTLEERQGVLYASPLLGKSGGLSSLVRAHGLVRIDMGKEGLDEGEGVDVLLF